MPEPAEGVRALAPVRRASEGGMTTWKAIGREISRQARNSDPLVECGLQEPNYRQPLCLVEEEFRAPSVAHQLIYQISRGGGSLERESWLEHEVQPTDSEIESIYKGRSSNPNEDQASMAPHAVLEVAAGSDGDATDGEGGELKNGVVSNVPPRSLARSVIDLSEPMSKEELLRTMDALRDIYKRKFGDELSAASKEMTTDALGARQAIERMDNEINELRTRMFKLSVEQHKLKDMVGTGRSPDMIQDSSAPSNERKNGQKGGIYQDTSTASSEIRTPSPRDTTMFIPLDQDHDDIEEKLKQRDKLILRQLQRRENLLQRRVQRATERRYLEEERRVQEQWIEKAKAEQELRRNFILQSHQLDKQEGRHHFGTLPRSRKKSASQLQLFLNGREFSPDGDTASFTKSSSRLLDPLVGKSSLDVSGSRFMAPTAASQRRMNRAASLMSGLNSAEFDATPLNGLSTSGGSLHDLYHVGNDLTHNYDSSNGHKRKDSQTRLGVANGARLNGSTLSLASNGRQARPPGKPMTKTNRNFMINAITHVSLAGQANKKQREAALQEIEASCARHFMILFRDHRLLYRALYTYSMDATSVEKIHGIGPMSVDESMIEKFFKYNSGNRSFVFIPARRFSIQCDAFIIHDEYWYKRTNQRR